jgi:hypothetical protein
MLENLGDSNCIRNATRWVKMNLEGSWHSRISSYASILGVGRSYILKNTPRYDPAREIFVSPSHEEVEKQPSVADATPLDEGNRTIMQSNAIMDDTNALDGQRELGASSHIEHFQQGNRPMRRDDFLPTVATEHIRTTQQYDVL